MNQMSNVATLELCELDDRIELSFVEQLCNHAYYNNCVIQYESKLLLSSAGCIFFYYCCIVGNAFDIYHLQW